MAKRDFIVLHTHGADRVTARSAGEAVSKCYVPGGFREVRGVVEAAYVANAQNSEPRSPGAAFIAFIGTPAGATNQ